MKKPYHLLLISVATSLFTSAYADNISPNLKINGFATANVASITENQGGNYLTDQRTGFEGYGQSPSMGLESLLGLQFDYRVDDQTNLVAQLVTQGRNNYDVYAEMAYVSYKVNDHFTVRGGRFSTPSFMYSESRLVGQAWPWVRLPVEAYYGMSSSNTDGLGLLARFPLGDWNLNAELLTGGSHEEKFQTKGVLGLNLSLSNENTTFRAGYIDAKVDVKTDCSIPTATPGSPGPSISVVPCPLAVHEEPMNFSNLGLLHDDGKVFFAAELSRLQVDGWVADWTAGYISAGYYLGKALPFVLWSKLNSQHVQDCYALGNILSTPIPWCSAPYWYKEQTTVALGMRYFLSPKTSLKAQYDHVFDFNNTTGWLIRDPALPPLSPDPFGVLTFSLTTAF